MRIRSVGTRIVEIPFHDGGRGEGITPTAWRSLEILLIRVEDEDGHVGWGEGFGYFTVDATKAIVDRMIAPLLRGSTVDDVPAWNLETQRRLHLFGRYGITTFAISGVDMALWDLAARRAGLPLHALLGTPDAGPVSCYASLVRYGDPAVAPAICEQALSDGFTDLKLHEITREEIAACRDAVGPQVPISVDVNGAWGERRAAELRGPLLELGISWLEEPVFPPEDFATLRRLRGGGLPIAAGENWCTSVQFAQALAGEAADFVQPSVTKVGGVSEFLKVADLAARSGTDLLPHCPYFGPGFFASLHLAVALPNVGQLEYLYVRPEAWLADPGGPAPGGTFRLPDGPGLGFDPDPEVMARFARGPR